MALLAVLDNGRDEDELAAKLGHVLDLNRRRNGLESQLVGILAEAIQAVNGK
jgi:plasmid stability protein